MVEAPQDEALAQRPRADVELVDLEQVEGGLGDERTGIDLAGAALGDAGQLGARGRVERPDSSDDPAEVLARQGAGHERALGARRGAGDPRQRPHRLGRADGAVRGAGRQQRSDALRQ